MNITVVVKNNYGAEVVYPADNAAQAFARIAGTKTLTRDTLRLVKELGYEIVVKQPEVAL